MNLPTEIFDTVVVVHTPDELGAEQADAFRNFVTHLERHYVVVDIDGTESLDSAGLTALIDAQEMLRGIHGDLKISTNNANNRKVFEMTRLDAHLEIFDSVIDAVKSYH